MLEYSFGTIFSWNTLAYINALVPAVAFGLAFFIPESPMWLISSKKDETRCMNSLRRLRDNRCNLDKEMNDLIMFSKANESPSFKDKLRIISQSSTYKPLVIVSLYLLLSEFSGLNVVTFYAIDVIKVSKLDIHR